MMDHVAAAKAIRKELKAAFPGVKFSARSSSFSMGDSVDVRWVDGPRTTEVDSIIGKYQYGSFDGMIDLYTSDNRIEGLPQSKYVMSSRDLSEEMRQSIREMIAEKYGIDPTNYDDTNRVFGVMPDTLIYRAESGSLEL